MNYSKKIFALPAYKDEAEIRRAYLLRNIIWVMIFIPIPLVLYKATLASGDMVRVLTQAAIGESVNFILLFMLYRKYVRAASILQVSALWLFLTVTAATSAGVSSESYLLGYALVIIIAGILLGGVGSFTYAFLSLLAGACMVYAQTLGINFPGMSRTPLTTWVVSLVLFPTGAWLQYLASSAVRHALEHASASEEKYRLISQVSSDYTFATEVHKDGSTSLSWVAGAFEKMTGYTYEEYVTSGGWPAHVHPDDLERDAQDMAKLSNNQDIQSEIRTFTKSGEIHWEQIFAHPIWDQKENRLAGIIGAIRDITEQKRIESILAYERDILQIFMDNIPDPVYFKDTESHFQRINQAHAQFLGVDSPQDAIGKTDLDFQNPKLARDFLLEEKKVIETGQPIINRVEFNTTKDGRPIWFSATKVPARNESGQIIGIVGVSRNITEEKQIEATLAYERDILQIFMDNIPDLVYFKDAESRFVRINQAQARFLGVKEPQDAIGKTDLDFQNPKLARELLMQEKEIMETGQPVWNSLEFNPTESGKPRWLSTTKVPAKNELGQTIGTIGISRDITEQKLADGLEQSRRAMLENVIKLGKILVEVNDINTTLEKIWHGIHDDLQFDRLAIFLYNAEHDSLDRAMGTDMSGNMEKMPVLSFPFQEHNSLTQILKIPNGLYFTHNYDVENNTPEDNEMYGVKDFASVAVWAGEKPVAVMCVDRLLTKLPITEIQLEALRLFAGYAGLAIENARLNSALQNELCQRKETLLHQSAILNGIPDMAWLKDKKGHYVAVNEQFAKTSGMKIEEIIGKTDFEIWKESFAKMYHDDDLEVMQEGKRKHHIEEPQIDSTGREFWVETTKTPILNEQNEVIGTTGIAREITERKKAELERESLIAELETKNAELERFTYTVSHDLKSPLVTIRGFLGYLERDAQEGHLEKLSHDKQRIESAVGKMQSLLNDLLELSRIGRLVNTPMEVSFSEIVKDALEILHGQIEASNVFIEHKNDNSIVKCDRVRIAEVVQNLIDNAIKFMGDQPQPHITIGTIKDEENGNTFFVRDNGIGIDKQYHERIFTLFNKLQPETEGTGIGLTLIKRIIEIHNGRIWLESELGKGTTFYFTLP
jgi:PAS domain S-box-containing protein